MTSKGANQTSGAYATSPSLLARARSNDAEAWERLVTLYAPLVVHWCRHQSLGAEDTADVFQEVFQAASRRLPTFRRDRPGDTFRGWLRTITRNKIHDHFRRRQKEPPGIGGSEVEAQLRQIPAEGRPESTQTAPPSDESRQQAQLLARALDRIRGHFHTNTWQAFWRTVIDARAPKDVAEELAMRPGAVRVAKSRVLQRLREELGDLG